MNCLFVSIKSVTFACELIKLYLIDKNYEHDIIGYFEHYYSTSTTICRRK